ncbi:exodeoxyribonuclease VII large subunit [Apilactobacillus kunkeei]|uniref:Exodeoxyribonuclease 7 large subunit n=1 Tax=Apilactobacillus kunkeei DSM 12361 = ATCC 700308 TaxID=1423768 RepID=A0A0R1FSB6_9LACO|nr:exodeoxyribonuclease VII large subunit [Apilactobacillus kunkeei]KOY69893.1 Exodeoxyribonuclease 7 large subunit [Apilactobacillus kunkeei]KOY73008.1 Exodeoxyribonuclease 7 large subunit [Apilactobacillus kunkeei DSM 12361 = ATCC 700308]KPN82791.1 Exodeoxyribonuclease 7 large subunit [Apilactobacillus kunkeei]KRK24736.1 exodeoxyribonuclease VII large subunit [Apilactobacillus kunkeei DSM 12361 = ATCC 700308]MCK8619497.1 exodeoxyribonuclease VII large subunit [Apilactobacillus kunkeei]
MGNDYLSVSDLTSYIKKKFDRDPYLDKVYLTGEISNFRLRPAHQYFSLKDDNAKISAIMFKSAFDKVKFKPEEGMKVLVTGRISVYEATGNYQIYIDHMEPDGVGALYQAYEQLKKKLTAEGLFSAPKKTLEKYPKRIAVVTSPSGAVIRDIITTTRRRYPIAQIVLYPAVVQGDAAASDIVRQINRVNEHGDFDTLIIGRGGGSIEDLWPFNEEIVARAIFDSKIPVISSVGHETDTTIADLVADVRAATPTAAAEIAVPVLTDVMTDIKNDQVRIFNAFRNKLNQLQQRLAKIQQSYIFKQPERLYDSYVQKIDMLNERLMNALKETINQSDRKLNDLVYNLKINSPKNLIKEQQQVLQVKDDQLKRNIMLLIQNKQNQLTKRVDALDHLSPLKVMSRGFSFTTNSDGKVVKKVDDIKENDDIELKLIDGYAKATVNEVKKESK